MKKILIILAVAFILFSCEQPTKTITETVTNTEYVEVPVTTTEPDNIEIVGAWEGIRVWVFREDYTFSAYNLDRVTVQFFGTYEMTERTGGETGVTVSSNTGSAYYETVYTQDSPGLFDVTMSMRPDGSPGWFDYVRFGG